MKWFEKLFKKEEPLITKLEVLYLKEGDVIVIECKSYMTGPTYQRFRTQMENMLPGVRCMILEQCILKTVLRKEDSNKD